MMRSDFLTVAVLSVVFACLAVFNTPQSDPGFCDQEVSGTIRWVNSTTWQVLDDAGHTPEGIQSVILHPTYVEVVYDFDADSIGSFQATPDEAFASSNVRVGASVATDHANIYFYMGTSSTPVNPALLSKANANVWLTGFFEDC